MVEMFLEFSLGPHGKFLRELYREHQLIVNSIVVGVVVYQLFFRKQKKDNTEMETKKADNVKEA